ncbi:MAG: hypothetical protein AB3N14_10895, partial [Flavobacteriaceae bacterium]
NLKNTMRTILNKFLKVITWIVLPFFFTSYVSPEIYGEDNFIVDGNYNLKASGSHNLELSGIISFRTAIQYSDHNKPFSTLKLDLHSDQNDNKHSLGFLICEQNSERELRPGKYKVPNKIEGLLNNFDGVFGFANFQELGEIPFFAQNGRINITRIGPKVLHGTIEVTLKNAEGKQLNINGDFTAIRRIIE